MNINLSRAKDDKGNLCFVMIDDNEEVFVDVEDYKEAKQLGIHIIYAFNTFWKIQTYDYVVRRDSE